MGSEKMTSKMDEQMLLLADSHSPEQISRELNGALSPGKVAARVTAMLKDRDWLSLAQQDQLVTWKLRRILNKLENEFLDLDNAKVQIELLKQIGARVEKRQKATDEELNRLYANQAQLMFAAIRLAFDMVVSDLRKQHPEIEEQDARDALRRALPEAVYMISERNSGDAITA